MITKKMQLDVCEKYGESYFATPINFKVGISANTQIKNLFPINGLRHNPIGDTTGWYIWAGQQYSKEADFFLPLHVKHLPDWRPEIIKFLGLPPGYRFLIGEDNYEDVWYDASLLRVMK